VAPVFHMLTRVVRRVELSRRGILDNDPGQLKNVAGDAQFADVVAALKQRLAVEVPGPAAPDR